MSKAIEYLEKNAGMALWYKGSPMISLEHAKRALRIQEITNIITELEIEVNFNGNKEKYEESQYWKSELETLMKS